MMKEIINKLKNVIKNDKKYNVRQVVCYIFAIIIIFVMPLIPETIGVGVYSLKETMLNVVAIATITILVAINIIEKKARDLKPNIYEAILGIYFVLIVISAMTSIYTKGSTFLGVVGRGEGVVTLFSYFSVFMVFMREYKIIKPLYKYAIIAATLLSIYGIIQAIIPAKYGSLMIGRWVMGAATGTMNNQNFFASYLCIFIPMMVIHFLYTKKISSLLICSVMFSALLASKTLGGYLTVFAAIITIIVFCIIFNKDRKTVCLNSLLLLMILLNVFLLTNYAMKGSCLNEVMGIKKETTKLADGDTTFGSGRSLVWECALELIKDHPLFGTGPDCFKYECTAYLYNYILEGKVASSRAIIFDKAHSEYIHIAATTGILSLMSYLIFIIAIVYDIIRIVFKKAKSYALGKEAEDKQNEKDRIFITMIFAGIFAYLIQAIANISVVQTAPIFWATLGIGAGINNKFGKEE